MALRAQAPIQSMNAPVTVQGFASNLQEDLLAQIEADLAIVEEAIRRHHKENCDQQLLPQHPTTSRRCYSQKNSHITASSSNGVLPSNGSVPILSSSRSVVSLANSNSSMLSEAPGNTSRSSLAAVQVGTPGRTIQTVAPQHTYRQATSRTASPLRSACAPVRSRSNSPQATSSRDWFQEHRNFCLSVQQKQSDQVQSNNLLSQRSSQLQSQLLAAQHEIEPSLNSSLCSHLPASSRIVVRTSSPIPLRSTTDGTHNSVEVLQWSQSARSATPTRLARRSLPSSQTMVESVDLSYSGLSTSSSSQPATCLRRVHSAEPRTQSCRAPSRPAPAAFSTVAPSRAASVPPQTPCVFPTSPSCQPLREIAAASARTVNSVYPTSPALSPLRSPGRPTSTVRFSNVSGQLVSAGPTNLRPEMPSSVTSLGHSTVSSSSGALWNSSLPTTYQPKPLGQERIFTPQSEMRADVAATSRTIDVTDAKLAPWQPSGIILKPLTLGIESSPNIVLDSIASRPSATTNTLSTMHDSNIQRPPVNNENGRTVSQRIPNPMNVEPRRLPEDNKSEHGKASSVTIAPVRRDRANSVSRAASREAPIPPMPRRSSLEPSSAPMTPHLVCDLATLSKVKNGSQAYPQSFTHVELGSFAEGLEQWRPSSSVGGSFQATPPVHSLGNSPVHASQKQGAQCPVQ